MAVAPTSFASPLIAALRGGISDTGSASTVSLLPNMAPNYSGAATFKPTARTGNINNVQPFAPMPSFEPDPFLEEMMSGPPVYNDFKLNMLELQKTEPEPEPEVPDYTEDLWPPIEPEPVAPSYTEPPPAISYPITMPSLIESKPLELEKTPSVEVYEVPVSDTPPVQTDPVDDFELDRELGIIQQQDVMEPILATNSESMPDEGVIIPDWDISPQLTFDDVACPAPWVKIQMADGSTLQAGELKPGMKVWTQHEHTGEWGAYAVTAVSIAENNRQRLVLEDGREFVGSNNHRVKTSNGWTEIIYLTPGDKIVQEEGEAIVKEVIELGEGPVVKITVQDAHTYVSEGFLSHNVKIEPNNGFNWDGGIPDDDWFTQYMLF